MHFYKKGKNIYPSVTTIVGYFKDKPSVDSLQGWANFLGFNHKSHKKELERKAKFGTLVHALIANKLASNPIDSTVYDGLTQQDISDARSILEAFEQFQISHNLDSSNTIFSEQTFVSEELEYAGTIDWLGTYKNRTFLIDFKTSSALHDSMKMQLAAYRKLLKIEAKIDINAAAILIVNKNGIIEHDIDLNELDIMYERFEAMYNLFKLYKQDIKNEDIEVIEE